MLRFDDEFHQLQAIQNYLWSYDSKHLHTVLLDLISTSPKASRSAGPTNAPIGNNPSSSSANFTPDGRVICRNYNRSKGCSLFDCNFAHVCNHKVNGKACALSHSFHSHQGTTSSNPPPPPAGKGPKKFF